MMPATPRSSGASVAPDAQGNWIPPHINPIRKLVMDNVNTIVPIQSTLLIFVIMDAGRSTRVRNNGTEMAPITAKGMLR